MRQQIDGLLIEILSSFWFRQHANVLREKKIKGFRLSIRMEKGENERPSRRIQRDHLSEEEKSQI